MIDTVSAEVCGLCEVAVRPGEADRLSELMRELVESTRAEPDALAYEWALGEDETVAHVFERYADSTAMLNHLAAFREKFAQRSLGTVEPARLVVYRASGYEVRDALAASHPVFMTGLAGFDERRSQ
jgi:quinol monooxygenase YgiN